MSAKQVAAAFILRRAKMLICQRTKYQPMPLKWNWVAGRSDATISSVREDTVTIDQKGRWLFGINAVINWLISIRGIADPIGLAATFGGVPPNYPFMLRLWMGFVFMFGCMFWEVSRNPRGKHALAKYNWIEKTLTATAVTIGYISGQVPPRLMIMIVLTNWLWIPLILAYDIAQGRALKKRVPAESVTA